MKCEQCNAVIPVGATYIYHTEADVPFCDNDCATEFEKDFHVEKVNDEKEEPIIDEDEEEDEIG